MSHEDVTPISYQSCPISSTLFIFEFGPFVAWVKRVRVVHCTQRRPHRAKRRRLRIIWNWVGQGRYTASELDPDIGSLRLCIS